MKLYYKQGACSLAVRILIHELNLECQYVAVNLANKQTEDGKNYLDINPKGSVPALQLDAGMVLTENAAIQQFLADTHNATRLLPAAPDITRYQVIEWLNFVSTELHKSCAPFFTPIISATLKKDIFTPLLTKKIDFLNHHLAKTSFLAINQFTIADIYCFVVLTWLQHINFDLSHWENVASYFKRIEQYPSVQKALQEEGLIQVTS